VKWAGTELTQPAPTVLMQSPMFGRSRARLMKRFLRTILGFNSLSARRRRCGTSTPVSAYVERLEDRLLLSTTGTVVQYDANPGPAPLPSTVDAQPEVAGFQAYFLPDGQRSMTPVVFDGEPGLQIDTVNGPDAENKFIAFLSDAEISDALTNGWSLSTRMAMPSIPNLNPLKTTGGNTVRAMTVEFATGTVGGKLYRMNFGTDGSGDPVVDLTVPGAGAGPSYTVIGGAGKFNDYDLVFDKGNGTVDLLVNGNPAISDFVRKFQNPLASEHSGKHFACPCG
jgi:hypothetical protein